MVGTPSNVGSGDVVVAVGFDDFKWAYNSVFHLCPMAVYVIDF